MALGFSLFVGLLTQTCHRAPPPPPMVTCSSGAPRGTWPEAWGLWELQDFNSGKDSVEEATQLRPGAAALQVGKAKWASSLPTPL